MRTAKITEKIRRIEKITNKAKAWQAYLQFISECGVGVNTESAFVNDGIVPAILKPWEKRLIALRNRIAPRVKPIPKDFPVQPLKDGEQAIARATCGHCGLSWDDGKVTEWTPTPSARCPFEYFHINYDEY